MPGQEIMNLPSWDELILPKPLEKAGWVQCPECGICLDPGEIICSECGSDLGQSAGVSNGQN